MNTTTCTSFSGWGLLLTFGEHPWKVYIYKLMYNMYNVLNVRSILCILNLYSAYSGYRIPQVEGLYWIIIIYSYVYTLRIHYAYSHTVYLRLLVSSGGGGGWWGAREFLLIHCFFCEGSCLKIVYYCIHSKKFSSFCSLILTSNSFIIRYRQIFTLF